MFQAVLSYVLLLGAAMLAGVSSSAKGVNADEPLVCVKEWSVAATIAKDHELAPVTEIASKAKAANAGTIVKTTLCASGERYIYQVLLRGKDGAIKKVRLDARNPQFSDVQ